MTNATQPTHSAQVTQTVHPSSHSCIVTVDLSALPALISSICDEDNRSFASTDSLLSEPGNNVFMFNNVFIPSLSFRHCFPLSQCGLLIILADIIFIFILELDRYMRHYLIRHIEYIPLLLGCQLQ